MATRAVRRSMMGLRLRPRPSPRAWSAVVVACIAIISIGCAATSPEAPTPAPTGAVPAPTGAVPTQPAPAPTAPAPTAATGGDAVPGRPDGATVILDDDSAAFDLPIGWLWYTQRERRQQLAAALSRDPDSVAATYQTMVEDGRMRGGAVGYTATGTFVGIDVIVADHPSLDAAAGSLIATTRTQGAVGGVESGVVSAGVGTVLWVAMPLETSDGAQTVPAQVVAAFADLGEGRVLTLQGVGTASDATFQPLLVSVARSLRRPLPMETAPSIRPGTVPGTDLWMEYPDRFIGVTATAWRVQVAAALAAAGAIDRPSWQRQLDEIDGQVARLYLTTVNGIDPVQASIVVRTETGDRDIDATINRLLADVRIGAALDVDDVDLPIGPARRVEFTAGQGAAATRSILYLLRSDERTTLVVGGIAAATDATLLANALDHLVRSLRRP